MLTTIAIAKMTRKLFSLDIQIMHLRVVNALLMSITGLALKKTLAQSSDHFPDAVNACSQESLRQD